mmetsp:Transcript_2090/g.4878  ORF Transcript_2090/g.4878 Transcript_2090/m.4878 type:complete len:259 (-) Transcript_2090:87-863(-)
MASEFRQSEGSPLMGDAHTADRPENWQKAKEFHYKVREYSSEEEGKKARKDFVIKVYTFLAMQLAFTVAVCLAFMFVEPIAMFVAGNKWFLLFILIIWIVVFIALFFLKNSYPTNIYLLFAFTGIASVMMGCICALYQLSGRGEIVVVAFAITTLVFVSLTLFAALSDVDFSFLGYFLVVALAVLTFWMLFSILFGFRLGYVFAALGVLIFSGFILYDTDQIIKHVGVDDHIIANIELYLDFINMFQFVLLCMGGDMG